MKRMLTIVIVLQAMVLVGQWTGSAWLSPANAQIPDAGAIRLQQLEEQRQINAKLDRLVTLLESGKLQVNVVPAEKK